MAHATASQSMHINHSTSLKFSKYRIATNYKAFIGQNKYRQSRNSAPISRIGWEYIERRIDLPSWTAVNKAQLPYAVRLY